LPQLRLEVRELLLARGVDKDRVDRKADNFIFRLVVLFGHSIVKRVSFAIGSEELVETYNDLLNNNDVTAFHLVDAAIQLDHFRQVPLSTLERLEQRVHQSPFAFKLLQKLVWERLYLFQVDYKLRRQLCDLFQIRDSPRLLNPAAKRIGS
jgi:hypothetical protein